MARPLRSDVVVPIEPAAAEALWRTTISEQLTSVFGQISFAGRVAFLSDQAENMERYGIPADADVATSFAGPRGMANILGQCFGRAEESGTLFVYWTEGTAITGRSKRDSVHAAVDQMWQSQFGVSPTRMR